MEPVHRREKEERAPSLEYAHVCGIPSPRLSREFSGLLVKTLYNEHIYRIIDEETLDDAYKEGRFFNRLHI